jgi:DNA-binding transcriptional LysR family regulator
MWLLQLWSFLRPSRANVGLETEDMDIYQLESFIAVAREGSIKKASEVVHLSQPAVSAHIKAVEATLGLTLFERTPRGMSLTPEGERLFVKAVQTLSAFRELVDEAKRLEGHLTGKLRLGAGSSSNQAALGRLLSTLAERCPEVTVSVKHGTSVETLAGLRNGSLDVGFYNEPGEPGADLVATEVSRFVIHVAVRPGLIAASQPLNWGLLAAVPWIYPTASACCGQAAEALFRAHAIRPRHIISVDREDVTRTLIAAGTGVGLLHADSARDAQARGEAELLCEAPGSVRVLFAQLASRSTDPLLRAATAIVNENTRGETPP